MFFNQYIRQLETIPRDVRETSKKKSFGVSWPARLYTLVGLAVDAENVDKFYSRRRDAVAAAVTAAASYSRSSVVVQQHRRWTSVRRLMAARRSTRYELTLPRFSRKVTADIFID